MSTRIDTKHELSKPIHEFYTDNRVVSVVSCTILPGLTTMHTYFCFHTSQVSMKITPILYPFKSFQFFHMGSPILWSVHVTLARDEHAGKTSEFSLYTLRDPFGMT